jgi:hypothetical protein
MIGLLDFLLAAFILYFVMAIVVTTVRWGYRRIRRILKIED